MKKLLALLLFSTYAWGGFITDSLEVTGVAQFDACTASTVPYLDSSKNLQCSSVTPTELGYLSGISSSIQTQIDGKQDALTLGNISSGGSDGISVSGGTGAVVGSGVSLSQHVSDSSHNGYLSSSDWSTFNSKQSALTFGNLTDVGTDGISVTGGTGSVIGSGTSLSQHVSDSTHNGYLSSSDWNTFNGKQAALTPGSISTSTTGVTVGSGSSSTVGPNVTVDVQTASTSQPGLLSATDWNTFNGKASLNSPAFTGTPTAPTASIGDSSTQIATTAFVQSQGFLTSSAAMPSGSSTSLVNTTSASTSFVNALTTSITITASSAPILAVCALDMTSATNASVATVRVTVNGVTGGSLTESITTATTQHLTVPNQNLSTSLGPGTYTVNCDFNRASGTGTVTVSAGSLTAVGLQGTTSNGITRLTGDVTAGPGSGSQAATIAAAAVTGSKIASATITGSNIASATITGSNIASTTITNSNISTVDASKITTGTLPTARGGTNATSWTAGSIPYLSNSTTFAQDNNNLFYDATNKRFYVGSNTGSARGNFVVSSGSMTALQAYNQSSGNAFQAVNVSAYTAALISRQNNSTSGASIGMEFGRGTPASPSGALSGDQIGVIAATPDASDGNAYGYAGAISFVAAENATTTATGGEIVLSTTPVTTTSITERLRVTNDGLVKSKNGFMNDTSGTQPTCNSAHRGLTWLVQGGAGVADLFQVCMKDASDNYNWVTK